MNCRNLHILLLLMLTQGAEEFKSVKDVPPANFLEQFSKDLKNSEVSALSQIKWIFNGKKAPADFKEKMLEEIKKILPTDDIATKLGKENKDVLFEEILTNFNNIFIVVK